MSSENLEDKFVFRIMLTTQRHGAMMIGVRSMRFHHDKL